MPKRSNIVCDECTNFIPEKEVEDALSCRCNICDPQTLCKRCHLEEEAARIARSHHGSPYIRDLFEE